MSFKREGNDGSQLNILKKRRVSDLLSNFIPEDEAALLSNGRYTCLVCSYRPVFDTVDMLTVHRQGKKHLEGLKSFYGKKSKFKNEIAKRKHEDYVRAEDKEEPSSSAPLLAQTRKLTHHALLKTVPYNSCHRKTSTKLNKGQSSTAGNTFQHNFPSACWKPEVSDNASTSDSSDCFTESCSSKDRIQCQSESRQTAELITPQRRREMEHYLKLKSNGWLQDGNGQWVKDNNVEFDSDEETPPSFAPSDDC
ncbi:sodium channel modifier 1 [Oryzias latipes]|uniref:Sodium channel modifier 1 n=1 Tax=Oryzias latipes TaxID=8090 RepID=A0A3B3HGY9_ORYLA|nr:sodium channel modifier 1 [Oryzias latipes]